MAELDPDKILAELASARLRQKAASGGSKSDANQRLMIGTIIILVVAALALWVLSFVLDQMPRPRHGRQGEGASASDSAR